MRLCAAMPSKLQAWADTLSDLLNAKSLGAPREQFIEFGLSGPHDLLLQCLYEPVDGGITDHRFEHPVVLVLKVHEHGEGFLPVLEYRNERDHVVGHGCL